MKLLSIAVPCYNSEAYMERCINSLLPGGEDVEIIIVNDGSRDRTGEIADAYASKYPTIVKAVHQENGGHGEAVNTGLAHATGLYFKVVDSDDRVSRNSYDEILRTLEELIRGPKTVDLVISNFVYDKQGASRKKVMRYRPFIPVNRVLGWEDVHKLPMGKYILMHSVIYRTEMLRESGIMLPKHTFYVDNIYVNHPLPYVKRLYYMDVNLYHYFIGREDQSVHEDIMIKRIDQQLLVNHIMIDDVVSCPASAKHAYDYMVEYLEVITAISSVMLILSGTDEALAKKRELWDYLKEKDPKLYRRFRHRFLGISMHLPGKAGRKVTIGGYKIFQKFYGFN